MTVTENVREAKQELDFPLSFTLNQLCLSAFSKRLLDKSMINADIVRECTLSLWLECITVGDPSRKTTLPSLYDFYLGFCELKGVVPYSYRPFIRRTRVFLETDRAFLAIRPTQLKTDSSGVVLKGFKAGYNRLLAIEELFYQLSWTVYFPKEWKLNTQKTMKNELCYEFIDTTRNTEETDERKENKKSKEMLKKTEIRIKTDIPPKLIPLDVGIGLMERVLSIPKKVEVPVEFSSNKVSIILNKTPEQRSIPEIFSNSVTEKNPKE